MKKTGFIRKLSFIILTVASILTVALIPSPPLEPVQYIDRDSGAIKTEKVAGEQWLVWLYNNPVGEAALWTLVKRKVVSSVYGGMMDSESSADKIQPFVDEFGIDLSIAQKQDFESFNDFFTRKLKPEARIIDSCSNCVVSPADGKVLAYADISKSDFIIKGYQFDVETFLGDVAISEKYDDGSLIIIRLAPNDYHRFHFPFGGEVSSSALIDGDYYSVNPIALREMVEIFCMNKREYTTIENPVFGHVIFAEVGATMVGSIVQTYSGGEILKGQEKGYFEFGGSTVVLLFEKDKILIDEDLLENTSKGLETSVKMGEKIGIGATHTQS